MKVVGFVLALTPLVFAIGCGGPDVTGTWRGDVTERGETVRLELQLRSENGRVTGKLTLPPGVGDAPKSQSFDIARGKLSGNKVGFIVPLTGRVDEDTLKFALRVSGNQLKGTLREMRRESEVVPVTFARRK